MEVQSYTEKNSVPSVPPRNSVEPFFSVSLHNYFLVRPEKSNFTDKVPRFMDQASHYS
jgi:hypothetical protein